MRLFGETLLKAVALDLNPLYLMLPVTITASLAFILPVATPPNAIVFAYGNMKIVDMVRTLLPPLKESLVRSVCRSVCPSDNFNFGDDPDHRPDP